MRKTKGISTCPLPRIYQKPRRESMATALLHPGTKSDEVTTSSGWTHLRRSVSCRLARRLTGSTHPAINPARYAASRTGARLVKMVAVLTAVARTKRRSNQGGSRKLNGQWGRDEHRGRARDVVRQRWVARVLRVSFLSFVSSPSRVKKYQDRVLPCLLPPFLSCWN